jgi:hypothetical protein
MVDSISGQTIRPAALLDQSSVNNANVSDTALNMMPAPPDISTPLWRFSNASERRDLLLAQATPNPQPGPARPQPTPVSGQPLKTFEDSTVNGFWIGESPNGVRRAYDPATTPLGSVPAIKPDAGFARTGGSVIFVNGIANSQTDAANAGQMIANKTGGDVRVMYNATQGTGQDLVRGALDNFSTFGVNFQAPSRALGNTIYNSARNGQSLHILSTSHGSTLTRNALYLAREQLLKDFGYREMHLPGLEHDMNRDAYFQQLRTNDNAVARTNAALNNIKVETFGATVGKFDVAGPKYLHWVNTNDPFVKAAGIDYQGNAAKIGSLDPGANSVVVRFTSGTNDAVSAHYLETYIPKRVSVGSFDQIYNRYTGDNGSGNPTIVDLPGTRLN